MNLDERHEKELETKKKRAFSCFFFGWQIFGLIDEGKSADNGNGNGRTTMSG